MFREGDGAVFVRVGAGTRFTRGAARVFLAGVLAVGVFVSTGFLPVFLLDLETGLRFRDCAFPGVSTATSRRDSAWASATLPVAGDGVDSTIGSPASRLVDSNGSGAIVTAGLGELPPRSGVWSSDPGGSSEETPGRGTSCPSAGTPGTVDSGTGGGGMRVSGGEVPSGRGPVGIPSAPLVSGFLSSGGDEPVSAAAGSWEVPATVSCSPGAMERTAPFFSRRVRRRSDRVGAW